MTDQLEIQALIDYHRPDCPVCYSLTNVSGRQIAVDAWEQELCEACSGAGTYEAFADEHDDDRMRAAVARTL